MKKLSFLMAILPMLFCACSSFNEENRTPIIPATPDLTAGFAEDTRTYVENNKYLRWHEDDRLTAFYGNTLNRQYKFNGKTGANSGTFSLVPSGELGTGNAFDRIYAVYPYNETATITEEGEISLSLPTTQLYAESSFGKGANTMIAVTENLEDTFLAFKNACGYLKLKLYGDNVTLASIEIKGNNNEKIAGAATATIAFGEAPQLAMADDATTTVTIDCGEGVTLGATAETATEFWVVLPETTFTKGLTIKATNTNGGVFEKSTANEVVITRNEILPMAAVAVEFPVPDTWKIYYTAPKKVSRTSWSKTSFGANIVSNEWNETTGEGVITFDSEVTLIGSETFSGFGSLTSIRIPDNVTSIGNMAFLQCWRLTSITIPNSVTSIGNSAFDDCNSLTSITIPDSVTSIPSGVFRNCSSLTKVTIPNGVTSIDAMVFIGCTSLKEVYCKPTIPPAITYLDIPALASDNGGLPFPLNSGMKIYVPRNSYNTYTGYHNYVSGMTQDNWYMLKSYIEPYDFEKGEVVEMPSSNEIWYTSSDGNIVTPYSGGINNNATALTTFGANIISNTYENGRGVILFDATITSIGNFAFNECRSLTSITIPNSVTSIGMGAFNVCTSLTNVTIPVGVTEIKLATFYYCSSLTSITIPDNVTSIGDRAFEGCSSMKEMYCKPTDPPAIGGDNTFYNCNSELVIYVPIESVNSYTTASGWENETIEGYDF